MPNELKTFTTGIADAIREKEGGGTTKINPQDFANRIKSLPSGTFDEWQISLDNGDVARATFQSTNGLLVGVLNTYYADMTEGILTVSDEAGNDPIEFDFGGEAVILLVFRAGKFSDFWGLSTSASQMVGSGEVNWEGSVAKLSYSTRSSTPADFYCWQAGTT